MCISYELFSDTFLVRYIIDIVGAMRNNLDVLKKGILVLLPEPDEGGRAIIYANLSLKGDGDPEKVRYFGLYYSCCCCCWLL